MRSKQLNTYQTQALSEITEAFKTQNTVLFHGVTSSGKTEIYVKLIEDVLQSEKQVLYLLPEIALTTQLVSRLQHYFGEQVAIYHSKYSVNERVEVWNHVLHNSPKARIVLGARSSILLPFNNLGLIIVDEEHEQSFKQFDPAPRYHARDAAVILTGIHKTKTILGSATPSIESYFNVSQGKYALVELKRRYNNVLMPTIELIDLQDKYKRRLMTGHFSDRLLEEITDTLQEKRQVILFQNRRGYSPILECTTCGHSPQCPNCDVSLTYHQYHQKLKCHYCGYAIVMIQNCMACGNATLDTKGFGTQQLEEEVKQFFPDVKVGRMDLDTTRGKYGYEKIITAFEQQEIDILVGTQMITKGLDFDNVSVVGVLNADQQFGYPDFRSTERGFQMIMQVSGRAGRKNKQGKVVIQTFDPHHPALQDIVDYDYKRFFQREIYERKETLYPPAKRMIKVTLKHKKIPKLEDGSLLFEHLIRPKLGDRLRGPASPYIGRIRNYYLSDFWIKLENKAAVLNQTKQLLQAAGASVKASPGGSQLRVVIDVDPY